MNHQHTLTFLRLDNNQISEIAEETLRQVPLLTTLKLRANTLSKLPDSLFSLAHLRLLDVSKNRLTTMSAKVSLLRQLRVLNIADNRLEGIPNSIGYLDQLDSITSEFFVYLDDQSSMHHSNNVQYNHQTTVVGGTDSQPTMTQGAPDSRDIELEYITRHHHRQTIARNGADARYEKLMRFFRLQIEVTSRFLSLLHEFQHLEGDYYRMLDSEPVLPTEESDEDLHIQCVPSFNNQMQFSSGSQIFGSASCSDSNMMMTPANLLSLSKFMPREEYNELVTLFRTLEPDPHKYNGTLIHTLISNNHAHLIKQYSAGMQDIINNSITQLQSSEAGDLIAEYKASKKDQISQQGLVYCLRQCFANKLRQAVNSINDRG